MSSPWPAAGEFLGEAYLRYSFTKGTEQEVGFLVETLGLVPGMRVLDVGCGPGRHAHALAVRSIEVVGLDITPRFIELATEGAPPGATFVVGDARALPYDAEFDAVISVCQGGFGLVRGDDFSVLEGMARAVRPGGLLALTAFSAYFCVRFLESTDAFDAATGLNVEQTTLKNSAGDEIPFELDTTCFTPRELRLLARAAGLDVEHVWSTTPGAYARNPPDLDHPEFLVVARRPEADVARRPDPVA
ncbi:MAG: methyltransferase domain-containing protein [Actinomycetota bacterium]|nr:methyltransferase domain-containing protein [Actinomycetota bacterium]